MIKAEIIEVLKKYGEKGKAFGGSYISYLDYESIASELQESGERKTVELPKSFKTLFRCLEDSCYEINFYGNDGHDNQEKIDGKELLIKWIKEAYFDSMDQPVPEISDEIIEERIESLIAFPYEKKSMKELIKWYKSELAKRV